MKRAHSEIRQTMSFSGAAPEAEARLAALLGVLLPGRTVTCEISQCADRRLINFNLRGGPEPLWYVHRDWNAELGEEVPHERTPEEEAKEQAEAAAYEKCWNASITARITCIFHALCDAMEVVLVRPVDDMDNTGSSFPDGYIRFTVPEDRAPAKPSVELAVYCETNPGDARSARLIVICLKETIAEGECKA